MKFYNLKDTYLVIQKECVIETIMVTDNDIVIGKDITIDTYFNEKYRDNYDVNFLDSCDQYYGNEAIDYHNKDDNVFCLVKVIGNN